MIYNEGHAPTTQPHYLFRANGDQVQAANGPMLIDLALGGGSMILGHSHSAMIMAIRQQSSAGSIYTTPHPAIYQMDDLLNQFIPWLPGRVWCNSGSEAVMRLCRIARAVTGKRRIGLFCGCWHGSWDGTLVEEDYRCSESQQREPVPRWKCPGIPGSPSDHILLLPYRDREGVARNMITEHATDLACVLVEPVQGAVPSGEAGPFLVNLRRTCDDHGVLLAFDEVVTGFRLAPGGGQERFGVKADLAAYGKVLGGGLPVGMVAGKKDLMDSARSRGVFFGGTFSGNPLTIAAGLATLEFLVYLSRAGDNPYAKLDGYGELLRSMVNNYCRDHGVGVHMMGCGSISRLILSPRWVSSRRQRDEAEESFNNVFRLYGRLRECGVHIGTNRIQFTSLAHSDWTINMVANTICDCLEEVMRENKS